MFITKSKYQKALDKIEHLEKSLAEAQNLKFVFERLTEKVAVNSKDITGICDWGGMATSASIMDALDESVPRYVDDYFGGKVIKQEATPVTILDKNGKATYGLTAKKPKGAKYILIHD